MGRGARGGSKRRRGRTRGRGCMGRRLRGRGCLGRRGHRYDSELGRRNRCGSRVDNLRSSNYDPTTDHNHQHQDDDQNQPLSKIVQSTVHMIRVSFPRAAQQNLAIIPHTQTATTSFFATGAGLTNLRISVGDSRHVTIPPRDAHSAEVAEGVKVGVGVCVDVGSFVGVGVYVDVGACVGVGVGVNVDVEVGPGVSVGVDV